MSPASPRFRPFLPALAIAALAVTGAACEPQNRATLHPTYGNAVAHNMAMQVVNPNPANVNLPPDFSGQRMAIAGGRYVTDTTKQVEAVRTEE